MSTIEVGNDIRRLQAEIKNLFSTVQVDKGVVGERVKRLKF